MTIVTNLCGRRIRYLDDAPHETFAGSGMFASFGRAGILYLPERIR